MKSPGTPYSRLWLDYQPAKDQLPDVDRIGCVFYSGHDPIIQNAAHELASAASAMTGREIAITNNPDLEDCVLVGTCAALARLVADSVNERVKTIRPEGFLIESIAVQGRQAIAILSNDSAGVLYGVFHFLRVLRMQVPINGLHIIEEPFVPLRMLNHWDDLDGRIERGYGGRSLWQWDELPDEIGLRCRDHARLCASIGINALVLNNVNADPRILRADYLEKVKALADLFREWGITIYLSANFGAPLAPSDTPDKMKRWGGVGDLDTADPLDPRVTDWWCRKADEIYGMIPDFGGFLVKADSEGMPGPRTYGRTHADGANMLARALRPHAGLLIWRAFVYGASADRARDAYEEFSPLDGQFLDNVILQVKNGPLDFQPREPFNPLFGSMPQTRLALEFQIAKEYMGHADTLAYLGPMWEEILNAETYAKGEGSTIRKVLDGTLHEGPPGCVTGVANTGNNPEWCGNVFNQANWYAFGRLAWDPGLTAESIAEEWIQMTFQVDTDTRTAILKMMMGSHDAVVGYLTPLGLTFLHDWNHYDPHPEMRGAYHGADHQGLGIDRTTDGSNAVSQYHGELKETFNDPERIPLKYLLWFHHVGWNTRLISGRTLWEELQACYDRGVACVDEMSETWMGLKKTIDPPRHASICTTLAKERQLARSWRDRCLRYFARVFAGHEPEDKE